MMQPGHTGLSKYWLWLIYDMDARSLSRSTDVFTFFPLYRPLPSCASRGFKFPSARSTISWDYSGSVNRVTSNFTSWSYEPNPLFSRGEGRVSTSQLSGSQRIRTLHCSQHYTCDITKNLGGESENQITLPRLPRPRVFQLLIWITWRNERETDYNRGTQREIIGKRLQ